MQDLELILTFAGGLGAALLFGEGEVALAMTEAVLRRLGATPDQIDRERQRVHGELLGVDRAERATQEAETGGLQF